jgi:hypothetical protein
MMRVQIIVLKDVWGCEFLREQYMLWGLGFFHGG